jgi:Domain of unknown function (DUF4440)
MPARRIKPKPKRRKVTLPSERALIQKIIRLEKQVWEAAQNRERERFIALVPADAVMIFQSGIVAQPEYLATMKERTISRYELRNIRGFMPNATTVILLYEAVRFGQESGQAFPPGSVIESTTWIMRGKRWVAILNQETPVRSS